MKSASAISITKKDGPEGLSAADRAMSLLFALAAHPSGMSLADLSRETGITLTTVHRMVPTLRARQLTRETVDGLQALGPGTLILARGFLGGLDFRVEALPVMSELREATNEACILGTLANPHVVCIDKLDSNRSVGVISRIGATTPALVSALGKAILANSSIEQLVAVIDSTQTQLSQHVNEDEFCAELDAIRSRGYSHDLNDDEPAVRRVAAPIFDETLNVIAAVGLVVPVERLDESRLILLGELVRAAAERISARLGHVPSLTALMNEGV